MRDILFRGKRKQGEWVQGLLTDIGIDGTEKETIAFVKGFEVEKKTVGQYTGLTDKNGDKIFEGDILESIASENKEDWKIWQVNFEDGSFVFDSVRKSIKSRRKYKYEQNLLCVDEIEFYGLVRIGNIHDNPELLKGGAE